MQMRLEILETSDIDFRLGLWWMKSLQEQFLIWEDNSLILHMFSQQVQFHNKTEVVYHDLVARKDLQLSCNENLSQPYALVSVIGWTGPIR